MAQTIKIKRSATSGNKLTGSNSIAGEIGMNTADKSLYIQTGSTDASVVTIYDDSILHLDDTNNRVGIGTTSPSNPLHVVGNALVVGTLAADELKVGPTERIYLDGGSNTFIVEDAADDLGIYVGGSRRLRVNTARTVATGDLQVAGGDIEFNQSSGQARIRNLLQDTYLRFQVNVGGTQTNAINIRGNNAYVGIGSAAGGSSPAYPLDVYNASVDGIARFTSGTNRARIEIKDDDTSVFVVAEGSRMGLGTVNALSSSNLTIDASGNLGIGTTVPDSKVTAYTASTGITGLFKLWTNTSNDTAADGGAIEWVGSGDKTAIGSKIAATRVEGGGKMDLRFYTGRNSDSNHEKMRILVDGKVGIGTTSPSYYFHVDAGNNNSTALFESDGVANVVVSGGNNRGSFVVQHSGTTSGALIAKSGGGLEFGVGANYATNVRMVLDSNGAVTFNDAFTFPTAIGSAGQVLKVPTSGTTLYWANEAAASVGTSLSDADGDTKIQVEESADEDKIRFDTAGTERVVIDSTGLAVTTAGVNGLILKQDTNNTQNSARLFFEGSGGTVGLMNVANELSFRTGMTVASTSGTERFNIHTNAVTAQVQFRAVDGNASTPGISFATDTNTGIFRAGADTLSISTAGTERLRVSANGNVGIGTGTASVSTKLEVHGTTTLKSQLDFLSPDGTDTISASMLNTDTLSFTGDSGQLFSITDSSSGTIFSVNDISGVPSIEVEDDGTIRLAETFGNVGIGLETPGEKLDVNGNVQADEFIGDLRGASLFKASAGEALSKGDVVYISGISGNTTVVSKADADDANKMPAFGIAAAAASVNSNVEVYTSGILSGIDTSSYSEGDELFVSTTAGVLTATPPTGESAALQKIGKVTRSHASSGSIFIIGAGRSNATPNLNEGKLFVGNSSNQAVADNTVHVDIANSRVGIGTTTTPATNLEVAGSAAKLRITDTRDQTFTVGDIMSSIEFDSDDTSGGAGTSSEPRAAINMYAASTFGSSTGLSFHTKSDVTVYPTKQMVITNLGRVGIGTDSPFQKLDVADGFIRVQSPAVGGIATPILTIGQINNAYQAGITSSLHVSMKAENSSGNFYWYPNSNNPIAILRQNGDFTLGSTNADNYVNTGSYFKPDTSGKFLAVTGSAHGGFLMLESSTVTDNDQIGGVFFTASAGQSDAHRQVAGIDAIVDAHSTNTALNGGDLRFFTKNVGSGLADPRMTIRSSGNVGIGTTTPGAPLDVNGIIRAVAGDASTSAYSITSNGGDLVLKAGADDVVLRTGGSGSEGIYFQDGAQDTKMFINAENGQVGIGNTDPAETLHVSGIGKFTGTSESSAVLKLGQRDNASTTPLHTIYSSDSGSGRPLGGDALEINTGRYLQIIGATRTSAAGADVRSWKFTTATNGNETGTSLLLYSQADASSSGSTTTVDRVSFSATSNQHSYINTAGNFGLGNSNPNRKLHLSGSGSTIAAKIEATDGSQASVDLKNSEGEFRIISDGGELSIYDQTDTAERLRIDTEGLVGIGTNNPLYNVDIHTTSGTGLNVTDDNGWATIRVDGGGGTDNVLELTNYGTTSSGSIIRTTGGGMLRFAAANTEAMRINANGNIGIGGSFSAASGKVCITESTANTASVFHTDGTSWLRVVPNLGSGGYNNLSVSGDIGLIFSIDNLATSDSSTQGLFIGPHTSSSNNGLKIQENGNIGIGTNSPSHKLHVVGDIGVNDNNKIRLGGSGDLELYHNATDSYIINNTGHTYLRSDEDNKDVIIQARLGTGGNLAAYFIADSSDQGVKLYHGGSQKFATISNGIRVSSNNYGRIQISDNDNSGLDAFLDKSGINLNITSRFNTGHGGITLRRYNGTTTLTSFAVDEIGDSKFYRDNGSTIGAVFDASTGRFGIGTSAPARQLDISAASNDGIRIASANALIGAGATGGDTQLIYWNGSNAYYGRSSLGGSVSQHEFRTGGTTRLTITSSGNVGIGNALTSPSAKLQVEEYGIETTTTTTSAATATTIDTFAAATFRSARYSIQVTNTTDSTYHMTEILLIHTGTTANITEYGTIFTGTAVEATFDADINSGNVRLRATPATADSMTFKVVRHCITV